MDARGPFAFTSRSVRLAAVLAMVVGLGTPGPGHAQIIRDGTVGPGVAVQPTGPHYVLPDTFGARAGANLFHSFQTFTLRTGQSATFTGPSEIANVISRVTGGERSTIDGLLRSQVGKANVWFLNPSGVVFGPNAQIDVPAAFHVSTADDVRFADGARFSASEPAASRLTVAPPEAFGFLRPNPAGIAVNGSQLEAKPGQTLSLAGGALQVTGGKIASRGGRVNLTATGGPGTVQTATGTAAALARGAVRLAQGAQVDSSGPGGGQISIRGGQIEVTGGSRVTADNTSAQEARRGITVAGDTVRVMENSRIGSSTRGRGQAGPVAVEARAIDVRNGGQIGSATTAQGQAGTVTVTGRDITVQDDGRIASRALSGSQGAAGAVTVTARGTLELRRGGAIISDTSAQGHAGTVTVQVDRLVITGGGGQSPTGISSDANRNSTGHAGTVTVTGRDITVQDDGLIVSRALPGSQGAAGAVTVTAHGTLELRNVGEISSSTFAQGQGGTVTVQADRLVITGGGGQYLTGISSSAERNSTGHAGAVTVTAHGTLELRRGGEIISSTFAQGQGGTVTVQADRLVIAGEGSQHDTGILSNAEENSTGAAGDVTVTGRDITVRDGGQISSRTYAGVTGAGGTVEVHGGDIRLADRGIITTQSDGSNNAGAVTIIADGSLSLTGGARIASSAAQADAGRITITTAGILRLSDSSITTEAQQGGGGQITLTVGRLIDLVGSRITSSTFGPNATENAGNLTIDPHFLVLDHSRLLAQANRGRGGNIRITAGQIIRSPDSLIDASSERGINGQVELHAPDQDVGRTLTPLPSGFLNASALLPTACATRLGAPASRFKPNLVASLPSDPNGPLVGSYLSYLGHRPPDRGAPSSGAAAAGTREAAPEPAPAGAGRLSFACGL